MTDPAELFARLTAEIEDLHALTVEGQSTDLPRDAARIILGQFCNGLQRLALLAAQIDETLGGPA